MWVKVCPAKAALRRDLGMTVGSSSRRASFGAGERHGEICANEFQMPLGPSPSLREILGAIVCYKGLRPGFLLIEIDCFLCGKLNCVNFRLSTMSFAFIRH